MHSDGSLRHQQSPDPAAEAIQGSGPLSGPRRSPLPTAASGRRPQRVLLPGSKWNMVREAMKEGYLQQLSLDKEYSVVSATFRHIFPDTFDRAIPVLRHGEVDMLLHQLDLSMWRYELATAYHIKTGKRMQMRTGFCGCCGPKVDVMKFRRREMLELQEKIRAARKRVYESGSTPSWFVFFKTQYAAAVASQTLIHGEDNREFRVRLAPGPEEVNWSALWMSYRERDFRGWIIKPLLTLLVLFPVGMFSAALMQLEQALCPIHQCQNMMSGEILSTTTSCPSGTLDLNPTTRWTWYCDDKNPVSTGLGKVITGFLPALLVTLWNGMVLPLLSLLLIRANGRCFSLGELDRTIAQWMWYFAAFNTFLGGIIGSTIASQFRTLFEQGPWQVVLTIGNYLPSSSSFFLNLVMFRVLVSIPMRLVQPHPGIRFYIIRRWLRFTSAPLTERDRAFLYTPTSARGGYDIGALCGVFLIAFAYAVISPIIPIACLVFFAFNWIFWRYTLLYIYVRKYESGGLMWPFVFQRILVMLVIMAVGTSFVFIVKAAYPQAVLLLVCVPVWVLRYGHFCYNRYQKGIECMPLQSAALAPPARVDPKVYIPYPLNKKAFGWHPEWQKPWSGWNLPA